MIKHFADVDKMVQTASGIYIKQIDYKLDCYACYLISQNGDPRKEVIALTLTYFVIQTRKQEMSEKEHSSLTEDEKDVLSKKFNKKRRVFN